MTLDRDELRSTALELGFDSCGLAGRELPDEERERLRNWLERDFHGSMGYMARPGIDRCDAETLMPGAQSVLMVSLDYPPEQQVPEVGTGLGTVSCYARGPDYHQLLKDRLKQLAALLNERYGIQARPFVDTAPLVERAFAKASGLGWYGKNACLIEAGRGSYFFLGGLVLDVELDPDSPTTAHCGSCTACLEACPTGALIAPYQLNARRCISYLTIEHRGAWPEELREQVGSHVYGCDICQAVCPWNRFSTPEQDTEFAERRFDSGPLTELFENATRSFKGLTRGTAATRVGKKGLLRNLATAMGNDGDPAHKKALESLLSYGDPAVEDHARWSLERLG